MSPPAPSGDASAEPSLGRPLLGRYWPTRLLAVGGMAEIYLARQGEPDPEHGEFGRQLVIKRLKPKLAADPRMVDMFLDEARVGALLDHPHVVQVHDAGEDDGAPFIAMEYVRGEELSELCRRGLGADRFLPLEHAAELIRQASLALGYVHALRDADGRNLQIVHCDVSPTNLLVTEDGFVKLIDFGIARSRGQRPRDEQALPGKLSYMSPEQAARRPLDHRSDIFSLGVVLYEIAVGRRLFRGPAHDVMDRLARCDIRPPTFVRHDFPGVLESIIMRALEASPADRYASAYDMADELDEFLRERDRRSGSLRVARYVDELVEVIGGARRPELVPERDRGGDDERLDFDRAVFDGYRAIAPGGRAGMGSEWDEYDEDDQDVADALGLDVGAVRAAAPGSAAAPARSPVAARREPARPVERTRPALQRRARAVAAPAQPLPPVAAASPAPAPAPEVALAAPAHEAAGTDRPAASLIGSPGLSSRAVFVLGLAAGGLLALLLTYLLA